MERRLFAALSFTVGLGAARLLNPEFGSAIVQQMAHSVNAAISQSLAGAVSPGESLASGNLTSDNLTNYNSCSGNSGFTSSLRAKHPQNPSLLKHVPSLPQRLSWYGITQESAIANAPKPVAPKPTITRWNTSPAESDTAATSCVAQSPNGAPHRAQRSVASLQQQAHFILSLANLNHHNDWLLQPQPQPQQPVHSVWRDQQPIAIKLAKQPQL